MTKTDIFNICGKLISVDKQVNSIVVNIYCRLIKRFCITDLKWLCCKGKQLTTYISQGSAATGLRGGGSFNFSFLRKFFLNFTVKNICKLVHLCRGYRKTRKENGVIDYLNHIVLRGFFYNLLLCVCVCVLCFCIFVCFVLFNGPTWPGYQ